MKKNILGKTKCEFSTKCAAKIKVTREYNGNLYPKHLTCLFQKTNEVIALLT